MFTDFYRCRACGNDFAIEHKSFWLGPMPRSLGGITCNEGIARHTQTFHCSHCAMTLTIPKLLIRPDWLVWKSRFESDYTRYPFLTGLVSRIDATFAKQPWYVDIGSITCPYCGTSLAAGDFQPRCGRCHSEDLEHVNQWVSQTRELWPPVV
jgi:ribosomal protein S27AE